MIVFAVVFTFFFGKIFSKFRYLYVCSLEGWMDGRMDGRTDGRMDGRTGDWWVGLLVDRNLRKDGRTDGQTVGWMDGRIDII